MLDHNFKYSVSGTEADDHHGQGLLLPRTDGCQTGCTVMTLNATYGAAFELRLASVNQGSRRST